MGNAVVQTCYHVCMDREEAPLESRIMQGGLLYKVLPSLVLKGKGNQKQPGIARMSRQKHKSKSTEVLKNGALEAMSSTSFLQDHTACGTMYGREDSTYPGPRSQRTTYEYGMIR